MNTTMIPEEFYAFLNDSNLTELIEMNKTTDDVFDVLNPIENQHSELLAWCMNPNEGHGQGDAVIKDFLEAAYHASQNCAYDNKKFFGTWTPGKIRTSSFGAAFVTREFSVTAPVGGAKGRLDLFLVDPQNRLLITIENKAGASLDSGQLKNYVDAVKSNVSNRKAFAGYTEAYIVLDRNLSSYSDSYLKTLGSRWSFLDYAWLERSAKRARHQIARGGQSARLLLAYCQRQTDWQSEGEKKIADLAVELNISHPNVVGAIRSARNVSLSQWPPLVGHQGELTAFVSQHRSVCDTLVATNGIALVLQQLMRAAPMLTQDLVDNGRAWLAAITPACERFVQADEDGSWPLYLHLFKASKLSTPANPRYNLELVWIRSRFDATKYDETELRQHFMGEFPELKNFANCNERKLRLAENLTQAEAIEEATKQLDKLENIASQFNYP